eukprot:s2967_g1.t2
MATSIVEGSEASQMATSIEAAGADLTVEGSDASQMATNIALCDLKLRCTLRRQLRMEHGGHAYEAAFAGGPSNDQFLR